MLSRPRLCSRCGPAQTERRPLIVAVAAATLVTIGLCVAQGMTRGPVWAFVAVAVPLVLVPGVSTAVVLRNSIAGGVRAGLETAVGVNAGSFCYGLLSAFGVALAIQRWPPVWLPD